jgi:hypothetical protein
MDNKIGTIAEHRETVEHSFTEHLKSHDKYLRTIKSCYDLLQTPRSMLYTCQSMLNILMNKPLSDAGNRFEKCKLGTKYIVPNNGLSTDPHFETGVAKIQQGVS